MSIEQARRERELRERSERLKLRFAMRPVVKTVQDLRTGKTVNYRDKDQDGMGVHNYQDAPMRDVKLNDPRTTTVHDLLQRLDDKQKVITKRMRSTVSKVLDEVKVSDEVRAAYEYKFGMRSQLTKTTKEALRTMPKLGFKLASR